MNQELDQLSNFLKRILHAELAAGEDNGVRSCSVHSQTGSLVRSEAHAEG